MGKGVGVVGLVFFFFFLRIAMAFKRQDVRDFFGVSTEISPLFEGGMGDERHVKGGTSAKCVEFVQMDASSDAFTWDDFNIIHCE